MSMVEGRLGRDNSRRARRSSGFSVVAATPGRGLPWGLTGAAPRTRSTPRRPASPATGRPRRGPGAPAPTPRVRPPRVAPRRTPRPRPRPGPGPPPPPAGPRRRPPRSSARSPCRPPPPPPRCAGDPLDLPRRRSGFGQTGVEVQPFMMADRGVRRAQRPADPVHGVRGGRAHRPGRRHGPGVAEPRRGAHLPAHHQGALRVAVHADGPQLGQLPVRRWCPPRCPPVSRVGPRRVGRFPRPEPSRVHGRLRYTRQRRQN